MKRLTYLMSALLIVFALGACEQQEVAPDASIQDELSKMNGKKVMNFRTHLSGDNEVPPVDTDATGQFILQYKDGEFKYKLIVANIRNVRGAHIHLGAAGSNGGVIIPLFGVASTPAENIPNGILAEGTFNAVSIGGPLSGAEDKVKALLMAIMNGNTYVNVHTEENKPGEIRGQIF